MYFVYVIQNRTGKKYIGQTNDLERRLEEHNNPALLRSRYTRRKGPWKLIYSEIFQTRGQAMRREKELKSGKGRDELRRLS